MTDQQILAMQSYILACVKYEAAHHSEKSEALMTMIVAQNRMHELLADQNKQQSRNSATEKRSESAG